MIRFVERLGHGWCARLLLLVIFLCILSQIEPQAIAAGSEPKPLSQAISSNATLTRFRLLTVNEGWILLDQQLYWTRDGGHSWSDVTPLPKGFGAIQAAFFLDTRRGWVVATDAFGNLSLGRTLDAGASWQTRSLSPFSSGDPDAFVAAVYPYFVDAQTGWLVTRRATSSNFDVGALFKTTDGGDTWTRLNIPIGDAVYFATPDLGWVAGGAAHDQLFATRDGGRSWTSSAFPFPSGHDPRSEAERGKGLGDRLSPLLPKFENARDGALPVLVSAGSVPLQSPQGQVSRLDLYRTRDGGLSWELGPQLPLGREIAPGTRFPIAVLNAEQSIAILPDRRVATRSPSGITTITASRDPLAGGIRELDMATPSVGWAKHVEGSCENRDTLAPRASPEGSVNPGTARQGKWSAGESRSLSAALRGLVCTQSTRLLRTTDGGQSWETLSLPLSPAPMLPSASAPQSVTSPSGFTATVAGQGFDACGLPSMSQFQNWWANSPYLAYNLYIGGSALAACDPLSASFVSQLASQGYKFFPTWVGPQASCSGFASRMSSDPTTAYNQGVAQANSALDAAYNLGLTDASKTGTIIYYDLEAYNTNDSTCRTAADYFIRGWSAQLKATGNVAGAYGGSCGSAVSDWASAPDPQQIPDVLWLAWWQVPYQYRYNATVWGAPCLSNSLWANHQRLRQYAGGHDETWGGVTLNIDSDVLDGVVASLSNVAKIYRYLFPFVGK